MVTTGSADSTAPRSYSEAIDRVVAKVQANTLAHESATSTCRHCGLVVTLEPYGGNRWWQPEWHSDNDDEGHSGFHCLENDGGQHEVSSPAECPTCGRSHCSCDLATGTDGAA